MSIAAFLPLRSPYPHQRSPPDAFSPRVNFSPRPVLAPMSRIPRIETASNSRRANHLPRDPSDWVDKDLLSYVRYHYSPIEAVPLSEVIERDRLTPTALWYLQAEPEQLLVIAEEESLRDTLLGLALSLKPAVSPTTPRIRHVRRLSEDLERPPPPPPPPPPSPPTPEEPEFEEDDDVAESVVSDWALDEDLDGEHGPTHTVDDLGDLPESTAQPEPPLEGLGLHTGEPHFDDGTTPEPPLIPMDTDDLINLEDTPQPTVPQEEAPEPHASHADTATPNDPAVEEGTSSQTAATDAHVPDAAEEKPSAATHHADPSAAAPSDEPSASREAGASMPADASAGSHTFALPSEDDDLGDPWPEDTSGPDLSPPPPTADPARTATPTSDYHDANSVHSDEDERQEAPPADQEPEPSPVQPQGQESATTSGDEHQPSVETPLPAETPVQGESEENTSSGEDVPTREEVQPEEKPAPASSEDPVQPPPPAADHVQTSYPASDPVQTSSPAADPVQVPSPSADSVQTPPPTTDPAQTPPPTKDPAQPSPSVVDPVRSPAQETPETQEEQVSPVADPEHDETAHVGSDESMGTQPEEPPVQSTTTSGIPASDQSQKTAEAKGPESDHLDGEGAVHKVDETIDKVDEAIDKVGEETVDKVGEDEVATVPATTTTEPAETTPPPAAIPDTVDDSATPEGTSDGEAFGDQANEHPSSSKTPEVQGETQAQESSAPMQREDQPETSSVQLEAPATIENTPLPPLTTTATTATPTAEIAVFDTPPSPTIVLRSGIEAQLVPRDPDDTEQTPSASPDATPPDASPSPSESRQASPPVETEKTRPPARALIPSSSTSLISSVNSTERKSPAPWPLNTAVGSLSEPSRSARQSTDRRTDNSHPTAFRSSTLSPTTAKTIGWGSAQSPVAKTPTWGRLLNTVSSFLAPPSESSSRDSSQERGAPSRHAPVLPTPAPARQPAKQSPWGQNKKWSAAASSSPPSQQGSKSKPPTAPSVSVSPTQVSPPTDIDANAHTKAGVPTPAPVSDSSPPERSEIQKTNVRAEELTDVMSDGVLIDPGTPSAGNGEPVRDAESSQAPPVQAVASSEGDSPDASGTESKAETKDAEDEDMVKVTADDVADADMEAAPESQPQGDVDVDEDEDDNMPLDRQLARVRHMTGDSMSSALTTDTESQGDDAQPDRRMAPKLQTSGLANEPDDVESPAVESPITPVAQSKPKKTKKNKRRRN